jgi:arabinose-5-phosphate isomerase
MQDALKILRLKNLGFIIARNNKKITTGILTDGDLKRKIKKNQKLHNLPVKKVMTPNPVSISQDMLATKALSVMQANKITALCVNSNKSKYKTTGVLHIHNILKANI